MQLSNAKNSTRGFFFTAMALAILSFMLLTTQVWVRTFEQKDEHASARFKGEAMRLVLSTLSDESMSEFANASAFYATSRLVDATKVEGLAEADANDASNPKTGKVEQSARELMMHGESAPSDTLKINYSSSEKDAYTLDAWQGKIRSAANVMGFNASFGGIENFTFRQADAWSVNAYFEMQMNLSDFEKTMSQSKRLKANATFSINGFVDPMVVRSEATRRAVEPSLVAHKQIWKHSAYRTSADVSPVLADENSSRGNGWFFGPVTGDYPGEGIFNGSEMDRIDQYILVHKYDGNLSTHAMLYGAVIVTDSPAKEERNYMDGECNLTEIRETNCLNCIRATSVNPGSPSYCRGTPDEIYANEMKYANGRYLPVMVAGSSWLDQIPEVPREGMDPKSQKFALVDNEFEDAARQRQGYHRIWDVTRIRDMSICGFYVQGAGPSFFQRMLAHSLWTAPTNNQELGIESFLVGTWAGGNDDQSNNGRSRLDWEFYSSEILPPPAKVKGMMGCKSFAMCGGTNATKVGVGHFRLSQNATDRYGLDKISCKQSDLINGGSPCE